MREFPLHVALGKTLMQQRVVGCREEMVKDVSDIVTGGSSSTVTVL